MEGIRVLRLLEYTYANAETAADDMARWTSGFRRPGHKSGVVMRSASLPFEAIEWVDPDPTEIHRVATEVLAFMQSQAEHGDSYEWDSPEVQEMRTRLDDALHPGPKPPERPSERAMRESDT